jgi:Carboxypeptidase regulatory-like domain/TonB dependent receptor
MVAMFRAASARPMLSLLLIGVWLLPALGASPAAAQSTLGTIRGAVRDAQDQVVVGAAVLVTDEDTGVPRTAETDASGNYEVPNLRAGRYRVEINAPSFKAYQQAGVLLRAGEIVRADATLSVGDRTETVTVTGDAGVIQRESQAIQSGLDAQQLETLPDGARDVQSFLYLNPNIVGDRDNGFKFLGARSYGATYIQDGQPSTGGIFGSITNSAPGLDAISEVKVLSNSYSAEYGGLAGVVVTTRRGTNAFSGSGFFDFNNNGLNALPYGQTLAGLQRGDPLLDTHERRYGATFGGPIARDKTFFLVNYEGSNQAQVGGGTTITVPTDAMRNGDFSATSITVVDPLTGQPFPGNKIPSNRLDPAAQKVLNFYYPHANVNPLASGLGRAQLFDNLETQRNRWDARVDHELSSNNSIFVRVSDQRRNPGTSFEASGFPNLGVQDRRLSSTTVTGSWNSILGSAVFNELRAGYNQDRGNRKSQYDASSVATQLGLQVPGTAAGLRGFPAFAFQGSNAIRSIADPSQNANRDTRQEQTTISDTLTFIKGRQSMKVGGYYTRNHAVDGFSLGVTGAAGAYTFGGGYTGNSFGDFLLGMPLRSDIGINTRGTFPLDASANEFGFFAQDDFKVNEKLTIFAGVRYEYLGNFVEKHNLLINFDPSNGALVLPDQSIAQYLSPQAVATVPLETAAQAGVGPSLVNADANNLSPRIGFAWRVTPKTVIRGGTGLFYPTAAAQGIRDALSRSPFRYGVRHDAPATLEQGLTSGTQSPRSFFGVNAVDLNLQSPQVLQYNITAEQELTADIGVRVSFIGSEMRKLLVNRDLNTMPASTTFFDLDDPADHARLPYPNLDPYLNAVLNAGEGWFRAFQVEATRRFHHGLSLEAAYTRAATESTAPDLGNSSLGVVQYNPYNIEQDRGPDPQVPKHRFIMNATWELPVGHGQPHGREMPAWADAVIGGWTVSGIFQARSGNLLTPYFEYGTDPIYPSNTGRGLETVPFFGESWRPDVIGNVQGDRTRTSWFNLGAFTLPAPGTTGNAKRGIIEAPGNWVVNFGLYKTVVKAHGYSVEFRATFENILNHPQFSVNQDSPFLDLTDYLINGGQANSVTNTLASPDTQDNIGGDEQFAPSRIIRLGLRVRF